MIKDNQQHFNRLHVIIDAFVIVVSYILAWWLKFSSGILDSPGGALSFGFYMKALVVIVPLYLILYYAFNLYTPKRVQGRRLVFQCRDGEHCRFSVDFYSIVQPAVLCGSVSKFFP